MKLTPTCIESARRHLRVADPVMKTIIDAVGPYTLRFERDRFAMLVRSIVSQQISTSAARAIGKRLQEFAGPEGLTAANLVLLTTDELRSVGLSPQKAAYVTDLGSDKSARLEFGLTQQEIIAAIREGKLQFQQNSLHGNPWFRLLRHEVEALVPAKSGKDQLHRKKLEGELDDINQPRRWRRHGLSPAMAAEPHPCDPAEGRGKAAGASLGQRETGAPRAVAALLSWAVVCLDGQWRARLPGWEERQGSKGR